MALLLITGLRTCVPALISSGALPAVTSVPVQKPPGGQPGIDPAFPLLALGRCPESVQKVVNHLRQISHFAPLRNHKGNKTFMDKLGQLPMGIRYREYDVLPYVRGIDRGKQRIVVDAAKRNFYYTDDHYRTFSLIQLP